MSKLTLKNHFSTKIRHCDGCHKDIIIPHNQVGGFWYLNGWSNPNGLKFTGGYCSKCFTNLHKVTNET